MSILSLYWAVLYNVEQNINSLVVYVVNFETDTTALVGPMITKMTEQIVAENSKPHLGFITVRVKSVLYFASLTIDRYLLLHMTLILLQ